MFRPSRELYGKILIVSNEKKPDDGHYRQKHIVFDLEYNILLDINSCVSDYIPTC